MTGMSAWLQLVLTLAGVAGAMVAGFRWALHGFEVRVGAVVRAETEPAFAQVDARFAGVDAQFVEVRHQMEVANHRLGAVEGDMSLIKRRLLSGDQASPTRHT